jgi:hypothetical protein
LRFFAQSVVDISQAAVLDSRHAEDQGEYSRQDKITGTVVDHNAPHSVHKSGLIS